jgi:hypothetical protein
MEFKLHDVGARVVRLEKIKNDIRDAHVRTFLRFLLEVYKALLASPLHGTHQTTLFLKSEARYRHVLLALSPK